MGKLNPHSHKRLDTRQRIIVGITFFSMFFGAGNLIFPPYLGALAGNRTLVGMVGFVVSAVGLPILGVIVVLAVIALVVWMFRYAAKHK